MHDGTCLVGQVILVVEGGAGPFARQLQAALESMGAETLLRLARLRMPANMSVAMTSRQR